MKNALTTIQSLEDLDKFREQIIAERARQSQDAGTRITVGLGTCGIAAGAMEILSVLQEHTQELDLKNITVTPTGCIGLCRHEPIVEVTVGTSPKVTYGRVSAEAADRILHEHILGGKIVEELVIDTTPFPTL